LLAEEPEYACPWQSLGQRGDLLLRAGVPQAAQQAGHGARAVEGGVGGGALGQRGDLLQRARRLAGGCAVPPSAARISSSREVITTPDMTTPRDRQRTSHLARLELGLVA